MRFAKFLLSIITIGCLTCCSRELSLAETAETEHRWWNDAVFYQVYVRAFQDSSQGPLSNDGIGDITGLIERLDYLNDGDESTQTDLGVQALWLLPVAESSHPAGFAVFDYEKVEQDYGTNDDFRELISAAHQRGIRVVVDLVLNHTAREHPWFLAAADTDSPYHNFYVWRDAPPSGLDDESAKRWHELENGKWYYARFGRGVPDLNLANPVVTEKLYEVARFWLEQMDVDGFRLDAIKHLFEDGPIDEHVDATHQWIKDFFKFCKAVKPNCYLVGEVWSDTKAVATYGTDEIDMGFQFELAGAFLAAAREGQVGDLAMIQKLVRDVNAPLQYAPFLSNHDMTRAMEQLGRDPRKMRVAAALLLTAPGVPFVFYGEEVGISGSDSKGRSPMQWDPTRYAGFSTVEPYRSIGPESARFNVVSQTDDAESVLGVFRQLIHLRNKYNVLRRGDYVELLSSTSINQPPTTEDAPIYAFARKFGNDVLLCVVNLSDQEITEYSIGGGESVGSAVDATGAVNLVTGKAVTMPTFDASGFLEAYRPADSLPAHSWHLIRLTR